MKNLLICCILFALFTGCNRRQQTLVVSESDSVAVTIVDTLAEDTLAELFISPVEEKVFSGRDGLFEEFLYEFFVDSVMQMHRIRFPLSYSCKGKELLLDEKKWSSSELFALTDIYHTLVERDAEMEIERDTAVTKANLDCLDMQSGVVRTFCFEKQEGHWYLLHVIEQEVNSYKHRDFYRFYYRFVNDSLYQSLHVNDPMTFVTVDPEDEFSILEANIDMEQWFAFQPMLPEHLLVNIDYGVKPSRRPKRKILTCKSMGENFSTTSYFRLIDGEWMLTRFEDVSN